MCVHPLKDTLCFETGSLSQLVALKLAKLAGQRAWDPPFFDFQLWNYRSIPHLAFYICTKDLNSDLYPCVAISLHIKLASLSPIAYFLLILIYV